MKCDAVVLFCGAGDGAWIFHQQNELNRIAGELVGRALEVTREIFDRLDVAVSGSLSVITTLEFLEHHFAKVGHRSSPYDPTLSLHLVTAPLLTSGTRKRPPQSGSVQTGFGDMCRSWISRIS
jgi:hypothetical protein